MSVLLISQLLYEVIMPASPSQILNDSVRGIMVPIFIGVLVKCILPFVSVAACQGFKQYSQERSISRSGFPVWQEQQSGNQ
jgi:hypothetical protein